MKYGLIYIESYLTQYQHLSEDDTLPESGFCVGLKGSAGAGVEGRAVEFGFGVDPGVALTAYTNVGNNNNSNNKHIFIFFMIIIPPR